MGLSAIIPNLAHRPSALAAPVDVGAAPEVSTQPVMSAANPMSVLNGLPSASLPTARVSQTSTDQSELNRLKSTGSGVSQIENPWLRGIAKVADVVGTIAAPRIAQAIPGTTLHHNQDVAREEGIVANDQTQDRNAQVIADDQALAGQRDASAARLQTQADENKPFILTPEQAEEAGTPALAGQAVSARTYQRLFGGTQAAEAKRDIATDKNATAVQTTGMRNDAADKRNQDSIAARETISTAADKTRQLIAQMRDATSTGNSVRAHSGTVDVTGGNGKTYKVPADVSKRAALAGNVTENADAVDSLLAAHKDIVGAAGGRYTGIQQMIGSDDPAIAELGVRMHNIALASNGAHGVRAQGAIDETEKELFNHFKSGPNAIHAALQATRGSMKTFLDDESNFQNSGKRTGSGKSDKPASAADPLGIR